MAHIKNIWIFGDDKNKAKPLTAFVSLKPAGEVQIPFSLPDKFVDCILDAAQAAANLHEQQMKAAILAEKAQGE